MRQPGTRIIQLSGTESDDEVKVKQLIAVHNILNETEDGCGFNRICIASMCELIYQIILEKSPPHLKIKSTKDYREEKALTTKPNKLEVSIHECGLRVKLSHKLYFEHKINRLYEMTQFTEMDILKMPGIGAKSLREIKRALTEFGLELKKNAKS